MNVELLPYLHVGIQVCSCMHRTYDRVFGIYKIQRTIDCWTSRVYWGQYSFKIFLQFKKRYKCKTRIHNERSKNNPQCNDLYFTLLVKKYFVVLMLFTWKLRSFTIVQLRWMVYLNRRCIQDIPPSKFWQNKKYNEIWISFGPRPTLNILMYLISWTVWAASIDYNIFAIS